MLRRDPSYQRLRIDGYGAFGSAQYWLGKDHLLVVSVSGYVEKYQRFLWSDIQALMVRKTRLHYVWGFIFAAIGLVCLLAALGLVNTPTADLSRQIGIGVLFALAIVFGGLVLGNALRGPACVCHLRTSVQMIALPHVTRWRKAQVLLGELTPRIHAVQGMSATTPARPQTGGTE